LLTYNSHPIYYKFKCHSSIFKARVLFLVLVLIFALSLLIRVRTTLAGASILFLERNISISFLAKSKNILKLFSLFNKSKTVHQNNIYEFEYFHKRNLEIMEGPGNYICTKIILMKYKNMRHMLCFTDLNLAKENICHGSF